MNDTNYKIRAWMGANRVSGRKLAEMMGMSYNTLKPKLAGTVKWTLSDVQAMMKATGLSFDELF